LVYAAVVSFRNRSISARGNKGRRNARQGRSKPTSREAQNQPQPRNKHNRALQTSREASLTWESMQPTRLLLGFRCSITKWLAFSWAEYFSVRSATDEIV
jgi:hypothetical protein